MTMRRRPAHLVAALVLLLTAYAAPGAQTPPQTQPPQTVILPDALVVRLPPEWRHPVTAWLQIPQTQVANLAKMSDEALRQWFVRPLSRTERADDFLKAQLKADPAPRVRVAIVQAITTEARWLAMPDTPTLLERAIASDPDTTVSLTALERLRLVRMRGLHAMLTERLALAKTAGDAAAVAKLTEERDRWISLERGTMLPAFLRDAPPPFSVLPEDRAVRVLAFGDFGTGSAEQKATAETMVRYHKARPLDLAITVGDNFYSRGMESTSDPRWQTQWKDLYGPLGITFYAALGNHDWGHPDSPAAEILYAPADKSWRMPASYYTFTAGPVQFFALDTQSLVLSDRQLRWLDDELSRSKARWKVVYGHHPIYSGGNYEDRPDLIASLLPLLRNRADAYFCGHDHNLQAITPEDGVHFYVTGGGGAGLYNLRPYERSIFASRANGFAVIEADATQLKVALVDTSGKHVYENVIRRYGSR